MSRRLLDSENGDWIAQLRLCLSSQTEVDLTHFDFDSHGKICEHLAREYGMEISLDRDLSAKTLQFTGWLLLHL